MNTNTMNQYKALPSLDAKTAVKQALNQLFNFKGRARRSEFFWFVLAFLICNMALGLIYNSLMPILPATIVGIAMNIFVIPITARRLHDRNHSALLPILLFLIDAAFDIYMVVSGYIDDLQSVNGVDSAVERIMTDPVIIGLSLGAFITGVSLLVLILLDSDKQENRYGPSPKYIDLTNHITTEQ